MKELTSKIKNNLKRTKICYIIAAVVFLVQFVLDLIIGFSAIISNKISINVVLVAFSDWIWWCNFLWIIGSFIIGIFAEKTFSLPKLLEGSSENNGYIFLHNHLILSMTIDIGFSSPFIIPLLSVLIGQYGTFGLAILPAIIGHIFFIIAYCQTIKVFNAVNKTSNNSNKKQRVKRDKANKLLSQTGKIFFIKYYNQLKNQNIIDIVDVIQDNYTEKTLKIRIENAKKIFAKNLQVEALNIILNNEDVLLDQKMIGLTKTLLEKENIEKINQSKKNQSEAVAQTKKQNFVPDCSICKYNIDDTTCEVWRKKPTGICEEFKKNKTSLTFKI